MNEFTLPFEVSSESSDYVLAKDYEKQDAYILRIPSGKHIQEVINLKIKPTGHDLNFSLNIEVERDASAVIIEDWSSEVEAENIEFTHHIECHDNSQLKYIVLNSASDKTSVNESRSSNVHNDSQCDIYTYYFGSKKVDSKLVQRAIGKGAQVFTDVVAKTELEQDFNFNYEHNYVGKDGNGHIGMKAVALENGMVNLDGMVNISQSGGGSAGYLQQETLNLNPNTVVKATPGLKIDTNDVKAGHGASVRNLSDEDLYYFAARGISEQLAKDLLIKGFLGSELKKIEKWDTAYQAVKNLI